MALSTPKFSIEVQLVGVEKILLVIELPFASIPRAGPVAVPANVFPVKSTFVEALLTLAVPFTYTSCDAAPSNVLPEIIWLLCPPSISRAFLPVAATALLFCMVTLFLAPEIRIADTPVPITSNPSTVTPSADMTSAPASPVPCP